MKTLAEEIADTLFTNYRGGLVQRLVLTDDDPERNWGGLCYGAAVDRIQKALGKRKAKSPKRKAVKRG